MNNPNQTPLPENSPDYLRIGIWVALIVLLFWIICTVIIMLPAQYCFIKIPADIGARGQLGDSFNIVTSFVTSLTLVFLTVGVLYEHAQYKKLLSDSNEQKRASSIDSFESSLFRMLGLHNDVVNSIQILQTGATGPLQDFETHWAITGRECFKEFYEHLAYHYRQSKKQVEVDRIIEAYDGLYNQDGHHTGQYFRRLFNIIRYIDNQKIFLQEEKYEYARIVRSQLSNYEIKLLLYNSISPKGSDFSDYIERYKLLKGIAGEDLLSTTHWDLAKDFFGNFWE